MDQQETPVSSALAEARNAVTAYTACDRPPAAWIIKRLAIAFLLMAGALGSVFFLNGTLRVTISLPVFVSYLIYSTAITIRWALLWRHAFDQLHKAQYRMQATFLTLKPEERKTLFGRAVSDQEIIEGVNVFGG